MKFRYRSYRFRSHTWQVKELLVVDFVLQCLFLFVFSHNVRYKDIFRGFVKLKVSFPTLDIRSRTFT